MYAGFHVEFNGINYFARKLQGLPKSLEFRSQMEGLSS